MTTQNQPDRFVTTGQVVKDIRSIFVDGPEEIANEVKTHIGRQSVCDFEQQIISSLATDDPQSLSQTVRTHIRSTTGDDTLLKPATRLYLNPENMLVMRSNAAITRAGSQLSYPLPIAYDRSVIRHKATKEKCFTRVNNVLTFTRPATILITAKLKWGVWQGVDAGTAPTVDPSWRFSAGGNNRNVTSSLSFILGGSLVGGAISDKILPQTTVFYESEIYPFSTRSLFSSTLLTVMTPSDPRGKIESLSIELERSPYVLTFGARTDCIGFFKETGETEGFLQATDHDTKNYFDIIEL